MNSDPTIRAFDRMAQDLAAEMVRRRLCVSDTGYTSGLRSTGFRARPHGRRLDDFASVGSVNHENTRQPAGPVGHDPLPDRLRDRRGPRPRHRDRARLARSALGAAGDRAGLRLRVRADHPPAACQRDAVPAGRAACVRLGHAVDHDHGDRRYGDRAGHPGGDGGGARPTRCSGGAWPSPWRSPGWSPTR